MRLAPRARVAALLLALLLGAGAWQVARQDTLAAPAWLVAWTERHPDPRAFTDDEFDALRTLQGRARRTDVLYLLASLAAGCVLLAAWPGLAGRAGGVRAAVLVGGTVTLGVVLAGASVAEQARRAHTGAWTLGDDGFGALAGLHAETLRAWRERVPETDAVILLGTDSYLWSLVAWALHPRAIYPVLRDVPPWLTDAQLLAELRPLPLGREQGARWVVDLGALAEPERAAHAALLEVGP